MILRVYKRSFFSILLHFRRLWKAILTWVSEWERDVLAQNKQTKKQMEQDKFNMQDI